MASKPTAVDKMAPQKGGFFHASCVAVGSRAVLILGASGSGKSGLALSLMAYGATLVADDQTQISSRNGVLLADAPETIKGRIEARFVGIVTAETVSQVPVVLIVDMDKQEKVRLPPSRAMFLLGESVPLLHYSETPHFSAAILQILKGSLEIQ